jgi:hypothetical protein
MLLAPLPLKVPAVPLAVVQLDAVELLPPPPPLLEQAASIDKLPTLKAMAKVIRFIGNPPILNLCLELKQYQEACRSLFPDVSWRDIPSIVLAGMAMK